MSTKDKQSDAKTAATPEDPAEIADLGKQLAAYRKQIKLGGGEKRIAAQHSKGKLTARERLQGLLDSGSFSELDAYVVHNCSDFGMEKKKFLGDGVVTGYGKINQRPVYISSQDFTVMGGSLGLKYAEKIARMMQRSRDTGVPFIQVNDSGGARIQEGIASLEGYAKLFYENTMSSGVVPQISVILGPCAGGAVYSPAITDFIVMVDKVSTMFITGPQVIKAVTGEEVSFEDLGGAQVHNQVTGNAHFFAGSEQEAFTIVKRLLSFLPGNNRELPPPGVSKDPPDREIKKFDTLVPDDPRKSFDMRDVILPLVDDKDFLEVQPLFAQNIIVGFARLANYPVGIVANQPQVLAGVLDINAADKAARFIRFCDAFNIPLITLVDVPGFLPGTSQEHGGIIRHGAKMLYAYAEASVPKLTLIVRKAFGGAAVVHTSRGLGHDFVMAWPTAEIAVMGAEGAANIIFRREIKGAPEEKQQEVRKQKIDEYRQKFARPYLAAKQGLIDGVIAPRESRWQLVQGLEMTLRQKKVRPQKKHGNIPL